ncbi:MFS transporter [Shinella sp.]|jgi:predicted MFS family arabinose efflux permease|uniref:MFS transporter n=1 Tax=Shinella sp. TaxID=1870904 RepID=UPI003D2E6144
MLRETRAPPGVLFLVVGACVVTTARAMTWSFLAIKLQQDYGLSPTKIGVLLGAGSLIGAVTAPLVGALSDSVGRKAILTFVFVTLSIGMAALGLAETVVSFFVAQVVTAVAISIYGPMSRAFLSDICVEPVRLKYFSWRYTASNVGWATGPLIGVAAGVASTALFLTAASVYLILALLLRFIHFPSPTFANEQPSAKAAFIALAQAVVRDRRLRYFIGGGIFLVAVYGQWTATLAPYLAKNVAGGVEIFAYIVSLNGVIVLLMNPWSRRFVERVGPLSALAIGCALFATSQMGFMVSDTLTGFSISMAMFTMGEILVVPSEYVLVDKASPARSRGGYFGAQSFTMAGGFIGPAIGGLVLESFGGPALFALFAGFTGVGLMFFVVAVRMSPQTPGRNWPKQ